MEPTEIKVQFVLNCGCWFSNTVLERKPTYIPLGIAVYIPKEDYLKEMATKIEGVKSAFFFDLVQELSDNVKEFDRKKERMIIDILHAYMHVCRYFFLTWNTFCDIFQCYEITRMNITSVALKIVTDINTILKLFPSALSSHLNVHFDQRISKPSNLRDNTIP
jgi:hypothetical protein